MDEGLSQPPECWDYRCAPSSPTSVSILTVLVSVLMGTCVDVLTEVLLPSQFPENEFNAYD